MTDTARGRQGPGDGGSEFNAIAFMIQQFIGRISTATLVKIVSVTNTGGVSPVGYVDVQPLVNQLDGSNNAVPHGIVHNVPYFRLQGGANAVIIDPEAGDIGLAVFADRDISSVAANKNQANPGSFRRFSMADALYVGGFLNGAPSQYVEFSAAGIKLHSPTRITLDAPDIVLQAPTIEMNASTSITATTPTFTIQGNAVINGNTALNGDVTQTAGAGTGAATLVGPVTVANDVTSGGKSLQHHIHGGVQFGGSNTGQPV